MSFLIFYIYGEHSTLLATTEWPYSLQLTVHYAGGTLANGVKVTTRRDRRDLMHVVLEHNILLSGNLCNDYINPTKTNEKTGVVVVRSTRRMVYVWVFVRMEP